MTDRITPKEFRESEGIDAAGNEADIATTKGRD